MGDLIFVDRDYYNASYSWNSIIKASKELVEGFRFVLARGTRLFGLMDGP